MKPPRIISFVSRYPPTYKAYFFILITPLGTPDATIDFSDL
jgi:hypothetical protein